MDEPKEDQSPPKSTDHVDAHPRGEDQNDGPDDAQTPQQPSRREGAPMQLPLSSIQTTQFTTQPSPSAQAQQAASGGSRSHRNSIATAGPASSWSAKSDMQLGHPSSSSDISGDRVFPIRSVISVDPNSRSDDYIPNSDDPDRRTIPIKRPNQARGETAYDLNRSDTGPMSPRSASSKSSKPFPRRRLTLGGAPPTPGALGIPTVPLQLNLATSDKDSEESGALGADPAAGSRTRSIASAESSQHQSLADVPHVTARFTHIETEDGHSVITGRDGTLQRCEDEPIHTPGAVQGFGCLVALREEEDGCFVVRYVTENSGRLLGYSPRQLFRLRNFIDILTEEQQDNLLDHIDFIRDEDADPGINGPEVFSLSIRPPKKRSTKLWCAIHINPAHPDLIICEFELDDDTEFPLRPPDEASLDEPEDTLQANPSVEELEQSTEVLSKPLRILRSARKRRGEQGAMQVFDIMSQVQEQLASANNLETFLKILVGIVKELTGFHRVMVYQFDSSFNGKVVTELVDPTATKDLYHGLNFPASDIPRQARDLYKLNKVRLLYDRDLQTARIVCRTQEDLEVPLDMSHSYLRAMSPIHIKYLANMAVRSSMSISINSFNELWGLIACHSYGNHGMRVSFPIRKMCRLVGDTASRNIERLSYASRLQARKLINTAPTEKSPSGYIIASSDDLLRLFDADFGLLSINGETKILGNIEQSQEALAMLEYLRMRKITSVVASQDVKDDFPDLRYPPGFQILAGLLYVPLSVGGSDFIVFFRKGQIKEVRWAGNPYEKIVREGTASYLEPRTSFKTWYETVVGKCREWNEEQVETAAVLCLVYGKFIEVWRQKEAAMENSKLTRLLLANSAHEVRTPLNAIINYLEIALEGSLDKETRDNLARSHSASKSLIYVINDLLDLTKTEEGQSLVKDEIFDLHTCIEEATEPYRNDTRRKALEYSVTADPGLPRFVHGDSRRIRQAMSNVTANAVSHTSEGFVKVEIFVSEIRGTQAVVDFVVSDSGQGMSTSQLDSLFRDMEQVSTEGSDSASVVAPGTAKSEQAQTLGLGLAVVSRIVRNMDGQLRLKSEEGKGSRFVVSFPFQVPDESPSIITEGSAQGSISSHPQNPASKAPQSLRVVPEGEIMLVDRGSALNVNTEPERLVSAGADRGSAGRGSAGSRKSMESSRSMASQKSDAERLIDAIQTPLSLTDKEPTWPSSHSRQGSREGSFGVSTAGDPRSSMSATSGRSGSPDTRRWPSNEHRHQEPGTANVRDSKAPVRSIKIPDDYQDMPSRPQAGHKSGVMFELPNDPPSKSNTESITSAGTIEKDPLQVLVAEDDPINMKILRKRLERSGYEVCHAVNGQDCATVYTERSATFDVVLMDMQMPIVDGLTSTKMIRAYEKTPQHGGYSKLAKSNGRIPIFAVSASLVESEKQNYIEAGFDGWILKPIDFRRLNVLLTGIWEDEVRHTCLYVPGQWERGGWFHDPGRVEPSSVEQTTPTAEETTPTGEETTPTGEETKTLPPGGGDATDEGDGDKKDIDTTDFAGTTATTTSEAPGSTDSEAPTAPSAKAPTGVSSTEAHSDKNPSADVPSTATHVPPTDATATETSYFEITPNQSKS